MTLNCNFKSSVIQKYFCIIFFLEMETWIPETNFRIVLVTKLCIHFMDSMSQALTWDLLWSLNELASKGRPLELGEAVDLDLLWALEDRPTSVKESWLATGSPSKLPNEESCYKYNKRHKYKHENPNVDFF